MNAEKNRERRLRRKADHLDCFVTKSRRRDPDVYDYGLYALRDCQSGGALHAHGPCSEFNLDLDELEQLVNKIEKEDV